MEKLHKFLFPRISRKINILHTSIYVLEQKVLTLEKEATQLHEFMVKNGHLSNDVFKDN